MEERKARSVWLAKFVMPCEPALRQWLSKYRVSGLEIDDIVQETYAILAGLSSVNEIRNPRSYTFQTAYSVVLAYRRRSRIVSITPVADVEIFDTISEQPSPETETCDREELQSVVAAIAKLPERIRKVFTLRRINGLSLREVAQHLGITENIVEKDAAKGLQTLLNSFKRGGSARVDTQSIQKAQRGDPSSPDDGKDSLKAR